MLILAVDVVRGQTEIQICFILSRNYMKDIIITFIYSLDVVLQLWFKVECGMWKKVE